MRSGWINLARGAAVFVVLATTEHAWGQSSSDQAAAEALFKQGRDLMAAGHLSEACPKLAESQRLDPATGTVLNLATCYERNGQIASAWVTYKEAATAAQNADQPERAQLARKKAAELEPKLPLLTIVVPAAADRPDLQIKRDGETVGRPAWGIPLPVDPGVHAVEATAAGRKAWQGQASVDGAGAQASIEVPPLAEAPAEPAAPPATAPVVAPVGPPLLQPETAGATPPVSRGSGQRTAAWVTGGVGIAGLVAGGIFGALAKSNNDDASAHCLGDKVCDSAGMSSDASARHEAAIATIAFVAGGALTAAGIVLYLTAPSASAHSGSRVGVSPLVGAATGGIALHGGW